MSARRCSCGTRSYELRVATNTRGAAISGAASAIGNVGPGLGDIIGPSGSYQSIPDLGKLFLCAGMILGRLEIFAILVMFSPLFWKN